VKLYVDLESRELIECPGFRNPVTTLRFKRGDSAKLEVAFLTNGSTHAAIGDPDALTMRFGVKPSNRFDLDYLVYCDEWTMPDEEETSPVYVCYPSFNTVELDAALDVGEEPELASVTLMGEITWSEGDGEPTSTRTFIVIVENDVIRGGETEPTSASTRVPFDVGDVATDLVPVDYANGAAQKLALVMNTSVLHTIVPASSVEGSALVLYINNPYGNHPNLTFSTNTAIASSVSTVFPKHLEGGTYIAELVCVAGGTWFLKSFEEVIAKGPTLYFKGTLAALGNVWNSSGRWFLDAAATMACPVIPWRFDDIYKNSDLEFATGNLTPDVATGTSSISLSLGQNFTIRGVANLLVKLEYATIIGGSFQNVTTITNCTFTNCVIKMRSDCYWANASTWNNTNFTFNDVMFYSSTVNGGLFKSLSVTNFAWYAIGATINAGHWDMTSGIAIPVPYVPATGAGFLPRY
jgi:hypothetical protein